MDKQLREAITSLMQEYQAKVAVDPDTWHGIADTIPKLLALFHTYGNRERIDELEHIDDKPNVRLWFDGFYGVDDRIKELNREVES